MLASSPGLPSCFSAPSIEKLGRPGDEANVMPKSTSHKFAMYKHAKPGGHMYAVRSLAIIRVRA